MFPEPAGTFSKIQLAHSLATCRRNKSSMYMDIWGELKSGVQCEYVDCKAMSTDLIISPQTDSQRYEAVLRISEAIAACPEPEELAGTLADEIGKFLHFDHLFFVVVKENSPEIEYLVWGKGPLPFPELPIEELQPLWDAVRSSDPQHTANWDTEDRYPRFKPWAKKMGLGSAVRIPLTTPSPIGCFRPHSRHSESI